MKKNLFALAFLTIIMVNAQSNEPFELKPEDLVLSLVQNTQELTFSGQLPNGNLLFESNLDGMPIVYPTDEANTPIITPNDNIQFHMPNVAPNELFIPKEEE